MSALVFWRLLEIRGRPRVVGFVTGDSRWPDGTPVLTSDVQELDAAARTVQTRNTLYRLGDELPPASRLPEDFADLVLTLLLRLYGDPPMGSAAERELMAEATRLLDPVQDRGELP
jgi:hypothetical protein